MKILLVLTLKMYTVIFVHLIFVCKLIHVNLKPSLCFQVSVFCIFGSFTADDSCYDYCILYCVKGKNETIENSLSSHQRRFSCQARGNSN